MGGVVGDFAAAERLSRQFSQLTTSAWKRAFVQNIAEEYRDFMTDCFRRSESPYGDRWAPLKFRSSANGRGQKPLLNSGIMRGAVTPINVTTTGFKVSVGVKYATTHQYGATIRPKKAKALRFQGVSFKQRGRGTRRQGASRKGGALVFVKKVVIPARPFAPLNGMPSELNSRAIEASDDFMREHFEG